MSKVGEKKNERRVEMAALSKDAYAKHRIAHEEPGRWLLKLPDDGTQFWTEIICVAGRGLYVDGDIEPVVFRYGPSDFEARVHWMAKCQDGADSYFMQKATIGTGREAIETWDPRIAADDLRWIVEERVEENGYREMPLRDELVGEVIPMVESGDLSQEEMLREMYKFGIDEPDWIGVVPAPRLFYAHAALARLDALLEERRARVAEMRPCTGYAGMVKCALSSGHDGECLTVYPNADRCLYQFTDLGKPTPRCVMQVGHPGNHRPDR